MFVGTIKDVLFIVWVEELRYTCFSCGSSSDCEALRMMTHLNMANLLMESDYQIVINSILGKNMVPSQIVNHITDIANLAHDNSDIKFMYCKRDANMLADKIAKQAHYALSVLHHCNHK